jgi:hypothetical protein
MSKFEDTFGLVPDDEGRRKAIDETALGALVEEFGGLAGYKCKKDNGAWSQEGWDDAMMRLYENRELLDGLVESDRRGKAALDAMSTTKPDGDIARLTRKLMANEGR